MIGIDLFAGSGGLSLGARLAGIDVRLAAEIDPFAAETYAFNNPDTGVHRGDIRDLRHITVESHGDSTILFGGPPCQGFSTSNQRTRRKENPSNWLFLEFIRVLRLWRPDWVLFENVPGIRETSGGTFLEEVIGGIQGQGYRVSLWTLNGVDYGVPQRRSRLFVIGCLKGVPVEKPAPLVERHVTVADAISDLPDLLNGASINVMPYKHAPMSEYARRMRVNVAMSSNHLVTKNADYVVERYKYIPQGGNWEDIPESLMKNYADMRRCHTGIYYRLREDRPSVVIGNYRKNMLVHPTQDRGLSVREAARLQSFPDWYEFKGSIGFQQQQVGNAVPPLLAQAVFEQILARHNHRFSAAQMGACVVTEGAVRVG